MTQMIQVSEVMQLFQWDPNPPPDCAWKVWNSGVMQVFCFQFRIETQCTSGLTADIPITHSSHASHHYYQLSRWRSTFLKLFLELLPWEWAAQVSSRRRIFFSRHTHTSNSTWTVTEQLHMLISWLHMCSLVLVVCALRHTLQFHAISCHTCLVIFSKIILILKFKKIFF